MASTHRMIVIIPLPLDTETQETIATTIANAVGSTMEDEMGMFEFPSEYAYTETPTVNAAMIFDIAGEPNLYDALESTIATLNEERVGINQIRWYGIAHMTFDAFTENDLMESNQASVNGQIGEPFGLTEALADSNLQEREA